MRSSDSDDSEIDFERTGEFTVGLLNMLQQRKFPARVAESECLRIGMPTKLERTFEAHAEDYSFKRMYYSTGRTNGTSANYIASAARRKSKCEHPCTSVRMSVHESKRRVACSER